MTKQVASPLVKITLNLKGHTTKETKENILHREPANLMGGLWIAKSKVHSYGKDAKGNTYIVVVEGRGAYYTERYTGLKAEPYSVKAPKAPKAEAPTVEAPKPETL